MQKPVNIYEWHQKHRGEIVIGLAIGEGTFNVMTNVQMSPDAIVHFLRVIIDAYESGAEPCSVTH